jgi:hypothetical protein
MAWNPCGNVEKKTLFLFLSFGLLDNANIPIVATVSPAATEVYRLS